MENNESEYTWRDNRQAIHGRLQFLRGVLEARELSQKERAELDALELAVNDLTERVSAIEADTGLAEDSAAIAADAIEAAQEAGNDRSTPPLRSTRMVRPGAPRFYSHTKGPKMSDTLRSWFRLGTELETRQDIKNVSEAGQTSQVFEVRTGLVSNAPTGSYAVPITTLSAFETLLTSYCDWLKFSRVIKTSSGEELRIPVDATARQTTGAEIAAFINEAAPDADKSVVLEQRVLKSYMATSGIQRLSIELLQDAAIDIESLVAKALATRIGRLLSKVFTNGTGTNEPTGLLNAGSSVPTVNTAAAGAVGLDDLIGLYSQLDPVHQADPSCKWMMSPTVWGALLKLKDGANRPYFFAPQNGSDVTGPASGYILGKEVILNPHMEATIATGKAAVVVGAFAEFAIRQAGQLQLRKSTDAFWTTREVGYNSLMRVDSKVLDAQAFRALVGK
jgi:HK97 family phage major capsid protein